MSQSILIRITPSRTDDPIDALDVLYVQRYLTEAGWDSEVVPEPPDPNTISVSACLDRLEHSWIVCAKPENHTDVGFYRAVCTVCGQVRAIGDGA